MEKITKTIEIDKNTTSDIADVICWMKGYIEAKGEDWDMRWLADSLKAISDINRQLK